MISSDCLYFLRLFLSAAVLLTVSRPASAAVHVAFNNPGDTGVTANGYTAMGETVDISLNYAPATGVDLRLVNNTALGFINGTFANMAHGQKVTLTHGGLRYEYVANYYGGTGNDLVLQWAFVRLMAWGSNNTGQVGSNESNISQKIPINVFSRGVLAGRTVIVASAGFNHSLALCSDGTLAAWGANSAGQLGIGTSTSAAIPVEVDRSGVLAGKTVVSLAAGFYHSLALCADGTVVAWGSNAGGLLGNNSSTSTTVPVAVHSSGILAGRSVVAVSAGSSYSLALCSDGMVVTWGQNSYGQLGNNGTAYSPVPVAVKMDGVLAGRSVVAVSAGNAHGLALCADGGVVSWGYNSLGRLGNNSTVDSPVPVAVDATGVLAGRTLVAVSAAGSHSLALCADGGIVSWGSNSFGKLGNGGTADSLVPVAVDAAGVLGGRTVVEVSGGSSSSMAHCADGGLVCWGYNLNGQLGNNASINSSLPVNTVPAKEGERYAKAGMGAHASHSLALVASASLPVLSALNLSVGILAPPFDALTANYTVNLPPEADFITVLPTASQQQDRVMVNETSVAGGGPGAVIPVVQGGNTLAVSVSTPDGISTRTYTLTVFRALSDTLPVVFTTPAQAGMNIGSYTATGRTAFFSLRFAPPVGANLTVINNTGLGFIKGTFDNLAQGQKVRLIHSGTAYEFVANYYGGTGNDLVLQWATNRLVAWGSNGSGQIGDNSLLSRRLPVSVIASEGLSGKTVNSIAAGDSHTLVLCADGTLASWGNNSSGQSGIMGIASSKVPLAVPPGGALTGRTVAAIAAGTTHSLALCSDGRVVSFGGNAEGQLGVAGISSSSLPVLVSDSGVLAGKSVVAVSAGEGHSLALCSDGSLVAWGQNIYGQLGNNTKVNSPVPVSVNATGVLSGKSVIAVAAARSHSLALCSDGTLAAWGYGSSGRLGNNATVDSPVPVMVSKQECCKAGYQCH